MLRQGVSSRGWLSAYRSLKPLLRARQKRPSRARPRAIGVTYPETGRRPQNNGPGGVGCSGVELEHLDSPDRWRACACWRVRRAGLALLWALMVRTVGVGAVARAKNKPC